MAIKISGTTVIDDSRNLVNVNNISIGGAVGAANSVLVSTGSGIKWEKPTAVSGGGGGPLSLNGFFSSGL